MTNPVYNRGFCFKRMPQKFFLFMKLTILLLTVACMQVSANGFSQTITIDLQSVDLKKAMLTIEKKSLYRFLYSDAKIPNEKRVTIKVNNAPIADVLDKIFEGTSLSYRILESNIVVIKADQAELNKISEQTVSGQVTGEKGESLQGVSVAVKGSKL